VYDFPVLIRLNAATLDFSKAQANGGDIRFTDATGNPLPYQVERWDQAARQAEVWVLVPQIAGGSATQYITMHWGKSDAQSLSSGPAVFSVAGSHMGVWHLDEEQAGTGASNTYSDATGFGYNGSDFVSATGRTGIIGYGKELDGVDDYIVMPSFPATGYDFLTVSCWVRLNPQEHWRHIVGMSDQYIQPGFALGREWDGRHKFYVSVDHTKRSIQTNAGSFSNDGTVWYHMAGTYDGTTMRLYVNGTQVTSATYAGSMQPRPTSRLMIGRESWSPEAHMKGCVDEVRVSANVKSPDWIKLSYENQKDAQTLVVFGPVEESDVVLQAGTRMSGLDGAKIVLHAGSTESDGGRIDLVPGHTAVDLMRIPAVVQVGSDVDQKTLVGSRIRGFETTAANGSPLILEGGAAHTVGGKITVEGGNMENGQGPGGGNITLMPGGEQQFSTPSMTTPGQVLVGSISQPRNMKVNGSLDVSGNLTRNGQNFVSSRWGTGPDGDLFYNGPVGVGTDNTGEYALAVEGKIGCRELVVTTSAWADYVFDSTYSLMPLDGLKKYIGENGRLPGVPSENEVREKGISIGQMNRVLLEKIEELTLYVLDLENKIHEMKKVQTEKQE